MTTAVQAVAASVFAAVLLPGVTFGQTKSNDPVTSVRISGRITDHNFVPIRHETVTVGLCELGEETNSRTDQDGFFSFPSVCPYRLCDLTIAADAEFGTVLGQLEVVDGEGVDIGNLILDSSIKLGSIGHLVGPVTITPFRSAVDSKVALPVAKAQSSAAIFVGADGMNIVHNDGEVFKTPKEKEQVGCRSPRISEDRSAVGWLVDSDFCCASYPLPFLLVVYRPGKPMRRFQGDGRAIFGWNFVAGGKQVAFYQSFPHGDLRTHYELRDVETERLIGKWDEDSTSKMPGWVRGLEH
jgi:hypothetical protein